MTKTNIITRTTAFTTSYTKLDQSANELLGVLADGFDVYLCTGVANVGAATDALAVKVPSGTGWELQPVPALPVYVRLSVSGSMSYWYS